MPWSKLKNIILVILVITNLCLLAQVALPAIQSRRLLDQTREQAIQFLQGRGVQLDEGTVPQSIPHPQDTIVRKEPLHGT